MHAAFRDGSLQALRSGYPSTTLSAIGEPARHPTDDDERGLKDFEWELDDGPHPGRGDPTVHDGDRILSRAQEREGQPERGEAGEHEDS